MPRDAVFLPESSVQFHHVEDGAEVTFVENTFSDVVLEGWATATVHAGTTALNTTISGDDAYMEVFNGGIVCNTDISGYGWLDLNAGAIHRGTLQMEGDDCYVTAEAGAVIDFTVAGRTEEDGYLINNLALIDGAPTYTITVDENQTGVFKLAQNADILHDAAISIGTASQNFGLITVNGEELTYNGMTCKLENVEGNLTLSVTGTDSTPPDMPGNISAEVTKREAVLNWDNASDNGSAGVKGYMVRFGSSQELSGEGTFTAANEMTLTDLAAGKYYYQINTVDNAGNFSGWTDVRSFDVALFSNLQSSDEYLSWDAAPEAGDQGYVVEISSMTSSKVLTVRTGNTQIDLFSLPEGSYNWQVSLPGFDDAGQGDSVTSAENTSAPQKIGSAANANGFTDLFFVRTTEKWEAGYAAQHLGSLKGWQGTEERVMLEGRNKISDIFEGSSDANILLMTDDACGDGLFVDDIYTILGDQARLAAIKEIRAGAGDDIIDMTSQLFDYEGDGVVIRGGLGDDTIWANSGSNVLFGDAGNDRLVGASGDDVIVGGSGDDSMHGGGGDDIFTFGADWGCDTVEQIAGGSVTLWFEKGSANNWDANTLTYTDGSSSVTVCGISGSDVKLKFGDTEGAVAGAFLDAVSETIFEDKDKGMLA